MKTLDHCQNCLKKFDRAAYKETRLENSAVVIRCPKCGHQNVIIENAVCGYPFTYGLGDNLLKLLLPILGDFFSKKPTYTMSGCSEPPAIVVPYRTISGVAFRCMCKKHVSYKKER